MEGFKDAISLHSSNRWGGNLKFENMSREQVKAALTKGGQGAVVLGGFYGVYQCSKKGLTIYNGPDVAPLNTFMALSCGALPLIRNLTFRRHLGYGLALVVMDQLHEYKIL